MSTVIDHEKLALEFWINEINTYVAKGANPWGYVVYADQSNDFDAIAREHLKVIRGHAPSEAHTRFWESVHDSWNLGDHDFLYSIIAESDLDTWLGDRGIIDADDIQRIRSIIDEEAFVDESDSIRRLEDTKIPLTLAPYQAENFNYVLGLRLKNSNSGIHH